MTGFAEVLARRVRSDGATPLITCYTDLGRTELSAVTYANWVAKTATMIVDTLDAEPGDVISLPLLEQHPGHWMGLVWAGACWTAGVAATVGARSADDGSVLIEVSGPAPVAGSTAEHRLVCSLHPLALGLPGGAPDGTLDWAAEVRSEPDVYVGAPAEPGLLAWVDAERRLTGGELAALEGRATRTVLDCRGPVDPWVTVREGLLAPLLGGGSSVLVLSGDPDELAVAERAER